jgi:hypothetical protein
MNNLRITKEIPTPCISHQSESITNSIAKHQIHFNYSTNHSLLSIIPNMSNLHASVL